MNVITGEERGDRGTSQVSEPEFIDSKLDLRSILRIPAQEVGPVRICRHSKLKMSGIRCSITQ